MEVVFSSGGASNSTSSSGSTSSMSGPKARGFNFMCSPPLTLERQGTHIWPLPSNMHTCNMALLIITHPSKGKVLLSASFPARKLSILSRSAHIFFSRPHSSKAILAWRRYTFRPYSGHVTASRDRKNRWARSTIRLETAGVMFVTHSSPK